MGHTRLGKIPTTRRWRDVVATFASAGAGEANPDYAQEIPKIASSTMEAAASALRIGVKDGGLAYVFYFLTQVALSARRSDRDAALRALGIELSSSSSAIEFTTEAHRAIDNHFAGVGRKSDVWPAPGSEDTELGVLMELEVGHGEASVYARVPA